MHEQAERPDPGEQHEPDRQDSGARVMDDQAQKIHRHQRRQFGFAGVPLAEHIRRLDDPQTRRRAQQDVGENLEAVGRQFRRDLANDPAPDHEKAAHRIGDAESPKCA